jgi:hypothetical protein
MLAVYRVKLNIFLCMSDSGLIIESTFLLWQLGIEWNIYENRDFLISNSERSLLQCSPIQSFSRGFSISRGFLIDRKCLFYIVLAIEGIKGPKLSKMNRNQNNPKKQMLMVLR